MINCIKYILTLLFSLLISPLAALIALCTWFSVGSPILFRQQRIGQHGETITIYKFRSMTNATDAEGKLLDDEQRTTRFGHFLRKTSLDELPQIWNILRGELVWVGPRPLILDFHDILGEEHGRRHMVKPGLTGWAQINGRNSISYEEKFLLDLWYVENKSLRLDLIILLKTIPLVLSQKNVAHSETTHYQNYFTNANKENSTE